MHGLCQSESTTVDILKKVVDDDIYISPEAAKGGKQI
jgi:hypothetical protein